MNKKNLPFWLAANCLPGIWPYQVIRWLKYFSNIEKLFHASFAEWQAAGINAKQAEALRNANWNAVEKELRWMQLADHYILSWEDESYPALLKEIANPPLVLFVKGNPAALLQTQLAIVGARSATEVGLKNAEEFAYHLVKKSLAITSGLALGIDGASHRGALSANGITIAVSGTGLDYIYPRSHAQLAIEIIHNRGAIISEFPLSTPPKASNFPRRNRIISGLSRGVLVVEAALKSGSLTTARHALEQGREVFAIPGSIHQPLTKGCHHLIQQGAKLVETADDILEELSAYLSLSSTAAAIEKPKTKPQPPSDLSLACQQLLQQIEYEITPMDVILLRSGLTAGEVSSILLTLELTGYIRSMVGGYVRLIANQ